MPEHASAVSTRIIDDFLGAYVAADALTLSPREHVLVRGALEDFLLDEWLLRDGSALDDVEASLAALRRLAGSKFQQSHIASIELACRTLAARVERCEQALMIQREHCMVLSMQRPSTAECL